MTQHEATEARRQAFQRLADLFARLRELPPAEQKAAIEAECADEPEVLRELEGMLASHAELGGARLEEDVHVALLDLSSPPDALLPERVGRWRILRRIGAGGMGQVFEADDESGERVLSRAAEGEYQYTYYRPGAYRVHLIAWYAGEYRQISNEVLIRCD